MPVMQLYRVKQGMKLDEKKVEKHLEQVVLSLMDDSLDPNKSTNDETVPVESNFFPFHPR